MLQTTYVWIILALPTLVACRTCRLGQFLDETGTCRPCSRCFQSVVGQWCNGTSDTQCIKLTNFTFRNSHDAGDRVDDTYRLSDSSLTTKPSQQGRPYMLQDENNVYWKNLAFSLIAVLCVLVILTTIVVLCYCYRFKYRGLFRKCGVDENDNENVENGYVVIHMFRSPSGGAASSPPASPETGHSAIGVTRQSRNNRAYRPKRRLMTEYVDDVFESEDSAGSRSLRLPLEPIPEKSEGSA